ncbi:MAG: transposase [Anaerolineae bacterium]|nr:transposase [Anaerolineae bacterium]
MSDCDHTYPQRKSPRLRDYDYAQSGAYFVTICTYRREHLFGEVVDQQMHLSRMGSIAHDLWYTIPDHHSQVELDAFVVMPNHVHGIIVVGTPRAASGGENDGRSADRARPVPTESLGAIIGAYKSAVTRTVNQAMRLVAPTVWQTRYDHHIIRSEHDLDRIRAYVADNSARWLDDTLFTKG